MRLKQISVLAILLPLAAIPLLYAISFQVKRQYIRWQMEEQLTEDRGLTTLQLSKVVWYKPGKEIVVNGHLFDVKSLKKNAAGIYIITGLYDFQEQKLHNNLKGIFNSKSANSDVQALVALLSIIARLPATLCILQFPMCLPNYLSQYLHVLPHPYSYIVYPPPRLLSA